jgi:zinc/manganese transport system ATP-binding protein
VAGIARQQRLAVLISAHEINPLLPVMDRIVYLAAGRAVQGRTEDVITSEVLSRLYGHHVDVLSVHGRILVVADVGPQAVDDDGHAGAAHVQIIA